MHGHQSVEASLLRARALLRAGRHSDALAELGAIAPPCDDHRRSAEHQFLYGTVLARCGDLERANDALANADLYATSSCDRELIAEAAYYRALAAYLCGDLGQADDIAGEALDEQGGSAHGRLLELLGIIAGVRGDVDRQIMMLVAANDHVVKIDRRDLFLEANVLNNLAIPVAEVNPAGLADVVRERAQAIPWNDELQPTRFHVTHHLAWMDALAGDYLAAFRHFRSALDLAPTAARRAEALVGRSYLSREMGEPINAEQYATDAEELVSRVDWNATDDDERLALINLATLIAPVAPERAARHVERYRAIPHLSRMNAAAHGDPLYRAKEAHAFGLVAKVLRGRTFAVPLLEEAHRLFRSVKSNWRAGLVAMDLWEITGDASMFEFARVHAGRVPQSWLARRIARLA